MNPLIIDTHAHLDFKAFNADQNGVIQNAFQNGINKIINIGVNFETSQKSIDLSTVYPQIYATVAIHPEEIITIEGQTEKEVMEKLTVLSSNKKVVAIGECGLDYFYLRKDETNRRLNIERQQKLFALHIKLAKNLNLPLVIHSRDAFTDVVNLLTEHKFPFSKVVFHSWSYNFKKAQQVIEKGGFISLNAIATYPNAKEVQETAAKIDEKSFFLETDCPFLPPQSKRGQRNEPSNVIETASKIAELRRTTLEQIATNTTYNATNFFQL
ncbi:hypothetical protein A2X44_05290 [candidate division CPR3 bacterium GWF2_35_18]|uniref:Hydrolase, TatD family n=1 Tax=candidate division CPR3 bacterium GW2011_GWF2_35_18 TaxID=1618350 RepID=A0A0G0EP49_UNCC3|nr:MAG: Hydrolase, TatD family [candidate division CPR3 bacterium GW2011_GWF2_35_18]OGB63813.1 MAG: hypothetical protein A2X44_05290 [candidate division CPR3 bacterium GWF2_35_18]OGB65200.1 MAG: hypothetical protein A2250_03040 [candidate division CPR3 bacterium RIFOXYA2_FULL_35_13]OGB79403.1 MAG: hypothetical protein A2296_04745 [candidate division CPR3 bacterium RIFOXYB2_FULL_35_8]